jgi:DNA-binding phage protein
MIPPFGFTEGAIIAVLDSIKKLGNAVHGQDSASAECQRLTQNIHALQLIFKCLEALENNDVNQTYMDAVQVEADKSMKHLSELLQNVAQSEKMLEAAAASGSLSGDPKKGQQPTSATEELSRLHSVVNMEIEKMNSSTATGVEQLM